MENFVIEWQYINCDKCKSNLIISKKNEKEEYIEIVDLNFENKTDYEAKCECSNIIHYKPKIMREWRVMHCNKCDKNLKVYLHDELIINYEKECNSTILGEFVAKCECEKTKIYKNFDVKKWKEITCTHCDSHLKVYKHKVLIHNYNDGVHNIEPTTNLRKEITKKIIHIQHSVKKISHLKCGFCNHALSNSTNLKHHIKNTICKESAIHLNGLKQEISKNITVIVDIYEESRKLEKETVKRGNSIYNNIKYQEKIILDKILLDTNIIKRKHEEVEPLKYINDVFMGYHDNRENNELFSKKQKKETNNFECSNSLPSSFSNHFDPLFHL